MKVYWNGHHIDGCAALLVVAEVKLAADVHPHVALHAAFITGLNMTGFTNHAHCCNHNNLSGKTSVLGISWIK